MEGKKESWVKVMLRFDASKTQRKERR